MPVDPEWSKLEKALIKFISQHKSYLISRRSRKCSPQSPFHLTFALRDYGDSSRLANFLFFFYDGDTGSISRSEQHVHLCRRCFRQLHMQRTLRLIVTLRGAYQVCPQLNCQLVWVGPSVLLQNKHTIHASYTLAISRLCHALLPEGKAVWFTVLLIMTDVWK